MYNPTSLIEERAICDHSQTKKEVMYEMKTGDRICMSCGEEIWPRDKYPSVDYRNDYIATTRELAIVKSLFNKSRIQFDFKTDDQSTAYPCALVDMDEKIIKPVFKSVGEAFLKVFPDN